MLNLAWLWTTGRLGAYRAVMHQFLRDAALAFTYFEAFIMAAFIIYVVFWLPFADDDSD